MSSFTYAIINKIITLNMTFNKPFLYGCHFHVFPLVLWKNFITCQTNIFPLIEPFSMLSVCQFWVAIPCNILNKYSNTLLWSRKQFVFNNIQFYKPIWNIRLSVISQHIIMFSSFIFKLVWMKILASANSESMISADF